MKKKKTEYEIAKDEWMKIRFLKELTPEQEAEFTTFYCDQISNKTYDYNLKKIMDKKKKK